ncbi:MAG: hypothetical protein KDA74_06415, partial [Planctomycetaceae bacterium]|nr:hypothetical protein [Planctomycetaceae bacterium]
SAQYSLTSLSTGVSESVYLATKALRVVKRLHKRQMQWLKEVEPDVDLWIRLSRFGESAVPEEVSRKFHYVSGYEPLSTEMTTLLWPSDQEALVKQLESTRKRVALPVATLITQNDLNEASGLEGAKLLAGWFSRNIDLLGSLEDDDRQLLTKLVDTKLDDLVSESVEESLANLTRIGTGAEAVKAGNQWYLEMRRQYSFALRRPGFQRAIESLKRRRGADLASTTSTIESSIQEQTTTDAVDMTLNSWLIVPDDRSTEAGKALVQSALQRKAEIDRAQILAQFSLYEQSLMTEDKPGIVNLPSPSQWRKPKSEGVRFALMRALLNTGGTRINNQTIKYGFNAFQGLASFNFIFKDLRLLDCQPAKNGTGYVCQFQLNWAMELSEEMKQFFGNSIQGKILEAQLRLLEFEAKNDVFQAHLVLTKSGWRIPDLETRAALTKMLIPIPKSKR